MYEQSVDMSPIERQMLQHIDTNTLYSEVFRPATSGNVAGAAYSSPSAGLYSASPLGGYNAFQPNYPASSFGAASCNALSGLSTNFVSASQAQMILGGLPTGETPRTLITPVDSPRETTFDKSITGQNSSFSALHSAQLQLYSMDIQTSQYQSVFNAPQTGLPVLSYSPRNILKELPQQSSSSVMTIQQNNQENPQATSAAPREFIKTEQTVAGQEELSNENMEQSNNGFISSVFQNQLNDQQQRFMSSNSNYSFTSALRRPSIFCDSPSSYFGTQFQTFSPLLLSQGIAQGFPQSDQVTPQHHLLTQNQQNSIFLRSPQLIQEQEESSPLQLINFVQPLDTNSPSPSIITPPQKSMLNLFQQQQLQRQMQRYQQEKALLQLQQMKFTQQALKQQQIIMQNQNLNSDQQLLHIQQNALLPQKGSGLNEEQIHLLSEQPSILNQSQYNFHQQIASSSQTSQPILNNSIYPQVSNNPNLNSQQISQLSPSILRFVNQPIYQQNQSVANSFATSSAVTAQGIQRSAFFNYQTNPEDTCSNNSPSPSPIPMEEEDKPGEHSMSKLLNSKENSAQQSAMPIEKESSCASLQEESSSIDDNSQDYGEVSSKKQNQNLQIKSQQVSVSQNSQSAICSNNNNSSLRARPWKKQMNETKNIPKNFSKAIIGYIQRQPQECAKLLGPNYLFADFERFLVARKEKLTAIKDLRALWTAGCEDEKQETYNRVFRIFSFKFFRENSVSYIYSSKKIKNSRALITYRFILQRALHDPQTFSFMKLQN